MNRREFLRKSLEGILIGIPLIYNCEKNPVGFEEKERLNSIKNILEVSLKYPVPDFNIDVCLNPTLSKFHAFIGYEYEEINGTLITQYGSADYEEKATKRRLQGIYDLALRLNGVLHKASDQYFFVLFYNSNNKTCSIDGSMITREAVPNEIKNTALKIAKTNNKVTEFLKNWPDSHHYFEWYASEDKNCNPQIEYIRELGIWPLESNVIRVLLLAPGGWIPEEHPSINSYVVLTKEKVYF